MTERASWRLPPGVEPGTWEYVHEPSIAFDYDRYFADHALLAFDRELLERWLPTISGPEAPVVADLGCGSGRALVPLVERGYEGLAVDLSASMLQVVGQKRDAARGTIRRVCANLVQLDGLRDGCVDHAICLFSTLGMVKGRAARDKVLTHVARIVRPGGSFVLHVHNLWAHLRFPGGKRWLIQTGWQSLWNRRLEWGDKYYPYRGLANMYLHSFRRGEVMGAVRRAGMMVEEVVSLNDRLEGALSAAWFAERWRAGGWMIRCRIPNAG